MMKQLVSAWLERLRRTDAVQAFGVLAQADAGRVTCYCGMGALAEAMVDLGLLRRLVSGQAVSYYDPLTGERAVNEFEFESLLSRIQLTALGDLNSIALPSGAVEQVQTLNDVFRWPLPAIAHLVERKYSWLHDTPPLLAAA